MKAAIIGLVILVIILVIIISWLSCRLNDTESAWKTTKEMLYDERSYNNKVYRDMTDEIDDLTKKLIDAENPAFNNQHHTVEIIRSNQPIVWVNGYVDIPYELPDDVNDVEVNKIENAILWSIFDAFQHNVLPTMQYEVLSDRHKFTKQFRYSIPCLKVDKSAIDLGTKHPIWDKLNELDAMLGR